MRKVTVKVKEHTPPEDIVKLFQSGTCVHFIAYKGTSAIQANCTFRILEDIRKKGKDVPLNNTNFRILVKEVAIYNGSLISRYQEEYTIVVEGELV